ncbi:hypothetical protein D9615_009776 [Tricholomella constricta]|uniref:MARVEL domain-containing protein n=1 Tax=Tricholomella constricta TaxID=117010 RepID=A0A8H5LV51_9AGAR|nr:hypothetical protein D9615_009776 [Tricholomella constricta]
MGVLDKITDLAARFSPPKSLKPHALSGGIGHGGHSIVFDNNMIVSKPTIVFHSSQIFFNFLAMACFASVAAFQARWKVGPSGLSGFALFISIAGMFLSAFMLLIPVLYEKYDKFVRLARALKEVRVGFILTGTGTTASLLIAFIVTISAWTQPGCKNPDNDPHEDLGDDFKKGLDGWCSTKKAAAIFFWLAFAFWLASFILLILDWRSGKLHTAHPRDPPFARPESTHPDDDVDQDDDDYTHVPRPAQQTQQFPSHSQAFQQPPGGYSPSSSSPPPLPPGTAVRPRSRLALRRPNPYTPSYPTPTPAPAAGRPSMDAYGAFSDPAPTGFAGAGQEPRVSRTMQYADPYSAVRASVQGSGVGGPPSYEGYGGYR